MSAVKDNGLCRIASGLALCLAFAASASTSSPPPQRKEPLPSVAESITIFRQLEPELQRFVDQQPRLPGQDKHVTARITPDISTGVVWIDLDSGFFPKGQTEFSEDFGDKLAEVEAELYNYLAGNVGFKYVIARIGSKTINEIYRPSTCEAAGRGECQRARRRPRHGMDVTYQVSNVHKGGKQHGYWRVNASFK